MINETTFEELKDDYIQKAQAHINAIKQLSVENLANPVILTSVSRLRRASIYSCIVLDNLLFEQKIKLTLLQ